jgi:hypothetical protein
MGISTFPAASAGGITARNYKEQIFNASGTWTYPSSSNFDGTVEITCVGGGGAGGGVRNPSGFTISGIGGGGGGGRVIINKKVSVLSSGNQTVTIGAGGVSNCTNGFGSSSGRYSIFGSPIIANYYPDPHMRWGMFYNGDLSLPVYAESQFLSTVSDNQVWSKSRSIDSSLNTGYGAKTGGFGNGSSMGGSTNTSIPVYTSIFEVPSSTEFKLMFYYTYMNAGSASSVTPNIEWYDSTNLSVSTFNLATFTRPTSGTTFTQYTSAAFTSPSTARWARISFSNSGGVGFNGITLTPTSAALTTPVSGNTDGYQWGGSVDGSVTVKTSASNLSNFVIAQGGGAGAQVGTYTTTNVLAGNSGLWGWTQGGYPFMPGGAVANTEWYFGSSGGGAGGDATDPEFNMAYTTASSATTSMIGTDTIQIMGNYFGGNQSYLGSIKTMDDIAYYGGGVASYPTKFTTQANQYQFINAGNGGPGIEGYGAGGNAHWQTGASQVQNNRGLNKGKGKKFLNNFSQTGGTSISKVDMTLNNGQGGSGASMYAGSTTGLEGQNGSSGLVIVRWYE